MTTAFRSALATALLASLTLSGPASAAKLQGHLEMCDKQLCPWYESLAELPKGWEKDDQWTRRYKAVFMFPGGDHGKDVPVMYVRAHQGEPALDLDEYVKGAQDKWKAKARGAKIEKLDDLVREGKPTLKVYYYRNPSVADQGYELTAFMKDTSPDYKNATFFFQVVLSAPSKKELEKAKPAFLELLKGL